MILCRSWQMPIAARICNRSPSPADMSAALLHAVGTYGIRSKLGFHDIAKFLLALILSRCE